MGGGIVLLPSEQLTQMHPFTAIMHHMDNLISLLPPHAFQAFYSIFWDFPCAFESSFQWDLFEEKRWQAGGEEINVLSDLITTNRVVHYVLT